MIVEMDCPGGRLLRLPAHNRPCNLHAEDAGEPGLASDVHGSCDVEFAVAPEAVGSAGREVVPPPLRDLLNNGPGGTLSSPWLIPILSPGVGRPRTDTPTGAAEADGVRYRPEQEVSY